jgi:hypothetical protein
LQKRKTTKFVVCVLDFEMTTLRVYMFGPTTPSQVASAIYPSCNDLEITRSVDDSKALAMFAIRSPDVIVSFGKSDTDFPVLMKLDYCMRRRWLHMPKIGDLTVDKLLRCFNNHCDNCTMGYNGVVCHFLPGILPPCTLKTCGQKGVPKAPRDDTQNMTTATIHCEIGSLKEQHAQIKEFIVVQKRLQTELQEVTNKLEAAEIKFKAEKAKLDEHIASLRALQDSICLPE